MFRRLYSVIIITFKEGIRDKALLGIGLFALFVMGLSPVVVNLLISELHKVAVDFNISAITFAGLLLTFFVTNNLMSKDIDRHTIYCVLSKPFSRAEYILGKYLGIMLIFLTAFTILVSISTLTLFCIKAMHKDFFKLFMWGPFYKSIFSEFLMLMLLNAIVVFFSTITSSSFLTLLFSICTYIAGQTIEEVVLYLKSQADEIVLSQAVRTVIDISQYIFPNLSAFDLKTKASHAIEVPWSYLAGITCYSIVYSAMLLVFAAIIFNRRELT